MASKILTVKNLNVFFGDKRVIKNLSLEINENKVLAIIGPSGCGKSTFIRSINRLHSLIEGSRERGEILFRGENILLQDPILIRQKIGMVFQKPNPFPNMSIYDNTIASYLLRGEKLNKNKKDEIVESSLKKAALWEEVKDRLKEKSTLLSGGQQQRLCIARALAMDIEVLLLDEPTSALDPIATTHIENLIETLKKQVTIIMVTHNISQASRVSNSVAFMLNGELIEHGKTKKIFTVPKNKKTEEYLKGQF